MMHQTREQEQKMRIVPGQVIVGLDPHAETALARQEAFAELRVQGVRDLLAIETGKKRFRMAAKRQILLLKLEEETEQAVLDAMKILKKYPQVVYAEPDVIGQFYRQPDDPSYSRQYGLQKIQAEDVWDTETGSRSVRVAVMDSGVDIYHEDLAGNILADLAYNAYDGSSDVSDDEDEPHGTHVSGVLGAVGNNSVGISGVAWEAGIVPIKIGVNVSLEVLSSSVINGIAYCEANQIPIINASFTVTASSQALEDAIEAYHGLIVAAAGNIGQNNDTLGVGVNPFFLSVPAMLDYPNIITVAATNSSDGRPAFSNYGVTTVDLAAPGASVYSTLPNNDYGNETGTSQSAPHVAGTAVLLKSYDSTLTAGQMKVAMMNSVDHLSGLEGRVLTGGRLNAYQALKYLQESMHKVSTFAELKAALADASVEWVHIEQDLALQETLTINRTLYVTANNVTLTAPAGQRHFAFTGDTLDVTFYDTLLDGQGTGGGVTTRGTDITIRQLECKRCEAVNGGALYAQAGELTLIRCTFDGNSATNGGAVYIDTNATAQIGQDTSRTFFRSNTADNGGAVYARGVVDAHGLAFESNKATMRGGAVYTQGTFNLYNRTAWEYLLTDADYSFSHLSIDGNTAKEGGFLYATGSNGSEAFVVLAGEQGTQSGYDAELQAGLHITNCSAEQGGAVFATGQCVVATEAAAIYGCSAEEGAGLYLTGGASLVMNSAFIHDNTASGNGGGVYATRIATIYDCDIHDNEALSPGKDFYGTRTNLTYLSGGRIDDLYTAGFLFDTRPKAE